MRIKKTDAYLVNMMNTKGDVLMSEDDVSRIIDDRLGEIVDSVLASVRFRNALSPSDKLDLHTALRERLPALSSVHSLYAAFAEAKQGDR